MRGSTHWDCDELSPWTKSNAPGPSLYIAATHEVSMAHNTTKYRTLAEGERGYENGHSRRAASEGVAHRGRAGLDGRAVRESEGAVRPAP